MCDKYICNVKDFFCVWVDITATLNILFLTVYKTITFQALQQSPSG